MKNPRFRFLLRALLSCALIALLLSRLDWSLVGRLLRGVSLWPLCAGTALALGGECLMAERTRLILNHWGLSLGRRRACALTWLGQFCNGFLPGGVGGDMVKFYRVSRWYPHSRPAALVALVADRLVALAALLVLSVFTLSTGDRQTLRRLADGGVFHPGRTLWPTGWLPVCLVLGGSAFFAWLVWRCRRRILDKSAAHVQSVRTAFGQWKRPDRKVAAACALALVVHVLGIFAVSSFARSLAIPLTITEMFLVWPVVMVAAMMPVSVNGHGLREFVLLYYFGRWHVASQLAPGAGTRESVVALSLLVVVNDLICNLPGGFLLLSSATADQTALHTAPSPAAAPS